ncbi:hypothetical protein EDB19DRAFT_1827590 [Suillus lakei]|nr:hypothetical protein EDB19DRAFT_1827590 [Suillus lakei]
MPLPEDPFTDSMTPHLQWFSQQCAYAQPAQHSNQSLLKHCKVLELQIVKLTSECNTLKLMFQQLASAVQLPQTDSLDLDYSPDSCQANHRKVSYLEDENGDPLTNMIVKAIWKLPHGAWAELVRCKLALKTWGKATATARQIVHTLMENTYPLFKFADDGWKFNYLMSMLYSAWRRNHINDDEDWKKKHVDNDDEEDKSNGYSSNTKGKKYK